MPAVVISGCSGKAGETGGDTSAQSGAPWFDEVKPAASAGTATACAMSVSVPVAASWKAKPVSLDGSVSDGLLSQGGATLACEIDAKPTGQVGFIRVWTAKRDTKESRPVLEAFLGADRNLKELAYRDVEAGGMPAVEATYRRDSPLDEGGKRERAFAVAAPRGVVVVTLSGLTTEQYQAMLPAYALARHDITPAG